MSLKAKILRHLEGNISHLAVKRNSRSKMHLPKITMEVADPCTIHRILKRILIM
jgi:hypothetical protein